jgi:hypothetical protein
LEFATRRGLAGKVARKGVEFFCDALAKRDRARD